MARCLCSHGYGVHQAPSKPLRMRLGEPVRVWATNYAEMPLVCVQCDCERYRPRKARWGRPRRKSRKYCWLSLEDELPVCGKPVDEGKTVLKDDFTHEPSLHYLCVGCRRYLDDHPEELVEAGYIPTVHSEIDLKMT